MRRGWKLGWLAGVVGMAMSLSACSDSEAGAEVIGPTRSTSVELTLASSIRLGEVFEGWANRGRTGVARAEEALRGSGLNEERVTALLQAALRLLDESSDAVRSGDVRRLDELTVWMGSTLLELRMEALEHPKASDILFGEADVGFDGTPIEPFLWGADFGVQVCASFLDVVLERPGRDLSVEEGAEVLVDELEFLMSLESTTTAQAKRSTREAMVFAFDMVEGDLRGLERAVRERFDDLLDANTDDDDVPPARLEAVRDGATEAFGAQ